MNWWVISIGILLVFAGIGISFLQISERETKNEKYFQRDPFYDDGYSTKRRMPPKTVTLTSFLGKIVSFVGLAIIIFELTT